MTLSASQLNEALRLTGDRLAQGDEGRRVRLYVVGGTAGLLSGWLAASRSTGDVDVTRAEPNESWEAVRRAAVEVAKVLELPETWLNNECSVYAWCLPLGWEERCECVRTYGPLEVWRIGRQDFIAAKVVSAPNRPQDLEDLIAIGPSTGELDFTADHLDRLECESLDPDQTFEDARAILESLQGGL
ncbi:MAG: DUF6036 family nucleotidyltransferase [Phycisphaerales bacterium JB040]